MHSKHKSVVVVVDVVSYVTNYRISKQCLLPITLYVHSKFSNPSNIHVLLEKVIITVMPLPTICVMSNPQLAISLLQ